MASPPSKRRVNPDTRFDIIDLPPNIEPTSTNNQTTLLELFYATRPQDDSTAKATVGEVLFENVPDEFRRRELFQPVRFYILHAQNVNSGDKVLGHLVLTGGGGEDSYVSDVPIPIIQFRSFGKLLRVQEPVPEAFLPQPRFRFSVLLPRQCVEEAFAGIHKNARIVSRDPTTDVRCQPRHYGFTMDPPRTIDEVHWEGAGFVWVALSPMGVAPPMEDMRKFMVRVACVPTRIPHVHAMA